MRACLKGKILKAIKDCKWEVEIYGSVGRGYWWRAFSYAANLGIVEWEFNGDKKYKTKKTALNNFKKFAKLNGITNYKIEGVTQ